MASPLVPVGPGLPAPLLAVLKSHEDALRELQQPTQPSPLWSHATAATLEATAPAANYPECACLVLDINSIAVSTKVAGSYSWRRGDGTAL